MFKVSKSRLWSTERSETTNNNTNCRKSVKLSTKTSSKLTFWAQKYFVVKILSEKNSWNFFNFSFLKRLDTSFQMHLKVWKSVNNWQNYPPQPGTNLQQNWHLAKFQFSKPILGKKKTREIVFNDISEIARPKAFCCALKIENRTIIGEIKVGGELQNKICVENLPKSLKNASR